MLNDDSASFSPRRHKRLRLYAAHADAQFVVLVRLPKNGKRMERRRQGILLAFAEGRGPVSLPSHLFEPYRVILPFLITVERVLKAASPTGNHPAVQQGGRNQQCRALGFDRALL